MMRWRRGASLLQASVVAYFASGFLFLLCPFLTAAPAGHPCCQRQTPHCPIAPSLDRCPLFLSDARLAAADTGLDAPDFLCAGPALRVENPALWRQQAAEVASRIEDRSDTFLRNRSLRN